MDVYSWQTSDDVTRRTPFENLSFEDMHDYVTLMTNMDYSYQLT